MAGVPSSPASAARGETLAVDGVKYVTECAEAYTAAMHETDAVRRLTKELDVLYTQMDTVVDPKKLKLEIPGQLAAKRSEISQASKRAKLSIDELKRLTDEGREHRDVRMQENQLSLVLQKYRDALQSFNEVDIGGQKRAEAAVERRLKQVRHVAAAATEPDDPEAGVQRLSLQPGSTSAVVDLAWIYAEWAMEDRIAAERLAADVRELNQMFLDIAVLVDEQGEVSNDIRQNVESSVDHVVKGRKELVIAGNRVDRANKQKCYVLGCVVVVVFVAVAVAGGGMMM